MRLAIFSAPEQIEEIRTAVGDCIVQTLTKRSRRIEMSNPFATAF